MAKKKVAKPVLDEPEHNADTASEEAAPAEPADGTRGAQLAPAPMGSKAKAMRDKLASQPKVRVFIPLAAGEKQGVTQSVILNGYPLYIRKGTYVEVPKAVADVLEVKLKHKMSVENHPDRIQSDGKVNLVSYGN